MERLGKKRSEQIYRMLFVITKREYRNGYLMDKLQAGLDFVMDIRVSSIDAAYDARYNWKEVCALCDRLDKGGILTDADAPIIRAILGDPKFNWPSDMVMILYRMELERT
jgi:hypothetical protein